MVRTLLLALGGALILAALVVGFVPTKVSGYSQGAPIASCGSVFAASDDAEGADLRTTLEPVQPWQAYADRCEERRSLLLVGVLGLLLPGLVLSAAGLFLGRHESDAIASTAAA